MYCFTLKWDGRRYVNTTNIPAMPNWSTVWTVESFTQESVILHRTDSNGFKSEYRGKISSTGDSVSNDGAARPYLTWGPALNSLPGSDEERARQAQAVAQGSPVILPGHTPVAEEFHLPAGKLNLSGQWQISKITPDKKVFVVSKFEIQQKDDAIKIVQTDNMTGFAGITTFQGTLSGSEVEGLSLALDSTLERHPLTRHAKFHIDNPDQIHFEDVTPVPAYRINVHADDVPCDSQNSLHVDAGYAYERGRDAAFGQKDYVKSACWFQIAAFQGSAGAQALLAVQFQDGRGVATNYDQAFAWAQKSAAQVNLFGESVLANLYASGKGVPADAGKAAKLRQLIAQQQSGLLWSHLDDKSPSGLTLRQALQIGTGLSEGVIQSVDDDGLRSDCATGVQSACDALRRQR
jgi:Sel1 repeat